MNRRLRIGLIGLLLLLLAGLAPGSAMAQDVRAQRRPAPAAITPTQAADLTLTVTAVAVRPIQVWVRTAGTIDGARKVVTARVDGTQAALVKVGQRARAFPLGSRSSMSQARIVRVSPRGRGVTIDAELAAQAHTDDRSYVVEIVTEPGQFLSVPNEAVIEEGDSRVVYVRRGEGRFDPATIQTGLQGELFTQVTSGVDNGDEVVTFGSFFIDAEYKLKGTARVR
jgi:membrane fusion protein, copper/silver efflux system